MARGGSLFIEVRLADDHTFVVTFNHSDTRLFRTSDEVASHIKTHHLDLAFPLVPVAEALKSQETIFGKHMEKIPSDKGEPSR